MNEGYVYLLQSQTTGWYKVGYSKDPDLRVGQLNKELEGLEWRFVAGIKTSDTRRLEKAFHEVFATRRITRGKEWFTLGAAELELFKALADTVGVEKTAAAAPPQALRDAWRDLILILQDRGQAPIAAICEAATPERFEGGVLTARIPEDLAIYARFIVDERHMSAIRDASRHTFEIPICEIDPVLGPAESEDDL